MSVLFLTYSLILYVNNDVTRHHGAGNDHVSVVADGAGNGGGYLPPESVPSDFYCRETPWFFS